VKSKLKMMFSNSMEAEQKEFFADLVREDELGVVVRAHLRIERALVEVVNGELVDHRPLAGMRLDYSGYVCLALAVTGNQEHGDALKAIGKLRNKFAHRLDAKIGNQETAALYKSLGPNSKIVLTTILRKFPTSDGEKVQKFVDLEPKDRFILIALVIYLSLFKTIALREQRREFEELAKWISNFKSVEGSQKRTPEEVKELISKAARLRILMGSVGAMLQGSLFGPSLDSSEKKRLRVSLGKLKRVLKSMDELLRP